MKHKLHEHDCFGLIDKAQYATNLLTPEYLLLATVLFPNVLSGSLVVWI